jgi:hypothetical protein
MLLVFLAHQSELSENLEDNNINEQNGKKTPWRNKLVDEVEARQNGLVLGLKCHFILPMPWHQKSQRPKMEARAPF